MAQYGRQTILFVDEIHRFNKSQQDALLPHVESGLFTFIGATTENPSFEVNSALLSRAQVYVLKSLNTTELKQLFDRAHQHAMPTIEFDSAAIDTLISNADGDARRLLNLVEQISNSLSAGGPEKSKVDQHFIENALTAHARRFDKSGDQFYDQISALHKSVRGSNPEGELALGQALIYLAVASKSNASYKAFNAARDYVAKDQTRPVPNHLRNAPTKLMQDLGHGKEYRYAHDEAHGYAAGETYLPAGMSEPHWYQPVERGLESQIAEKMAFLRNLDEASKKK